MIVAKEIDGNMKVFYKVPEKWDNDIAFYMRDAAHWNSKGFYEVIEVTPSDTQERGAIYFDAANDVFTYPLIDLSQAELDAKAERELNSDAAQQAINQRRNDGMQGFDRIKEIIERKYRNGEITANQAKAADAYFHPLIKDLNFGSWILVKGILDGTTNIPAGYQSLFDTIKEKVDAYVTDNY